MSVLESILDVFETLKICPDPIVIGDASFVANWRVSLHTSVSAYADVLLEQHDAVNFGFLGNSAVMNKLSTSLLVSDDFVAIESEEKSASNCTGFSVVSRKTVFDERTKSFLVNS